MALLLHLYNPQDQAQAAGDLAQLTPDELEHLTNAVQNYLTTAPGSLTKDDLAAEVRRIYSQIIASRKP
jgi:hypothetical protein